MQVAVDIEFEELLKIVKSLPSKQLQQLKAVIESDVSMKKSPTLESLLLNGPTATSEEIDNINKNRKAINQWRTI